MSRKHADSLIVLLISIALTFVMDGLTNEVDTERYSWDFKRYINMAEDGILGNTDLVSPYAYRFLPPLIVRSITTTFGLSTDTGFRIVAYIGTVSQLFSIFLLARTLGFAFRTGIIVLLVMAFSMFNIKFLLFDIYRPDHLAYPLVTLAVYALIRRRIPLLLVTTLVGLQIREFLIIPALVYLVGLWSTWLRERSARIRTQAVLVTGLLFFAVLVPRLLIPVRASSQFVDPLNNPRSLPTLITAPLNIKRDINLVFVTAAYLLPSVLLCTRARGRDIAGRLKPFNALLAVYTGCVLLLAMYGGTDLTRFVSYLFIPQLFVLGHLLEKKVSIVEAAYMLLAVFVFNRIMFQIPIWDLDAYLDCYGGYSDRVNISTLYRCAELLVYIAGAVGLRALIHRGRTRGRTAKPSG